MEVPFYKTLLWAHSLNQLWRKFRMSSEPPSQLWRGSYELCMKSFFPPCGEGHKPVLLFCFFLLISDMCLRSLHNLRSSYSKHESTNLEIEEYQSSVVEQLSSIFSCRCLLWRIKIAFMKWKFSDLVWQQKNKSQSIKFAHIKNPEQQTFLKTWTLFRMRRVIYEARIVF